MSTVEERKVIQQRIDSNQNIPEVKLWESAKVSSESLVSYNPFRQQTEGATGSAAFGENVESASTAVSSIAERGAKKSDEFLNTAKETARLDKILTISKILGDTASASRGGEGVAVLRDSILQEGIETGVDVFVMRAFTHTLATVAGFLDTPIPGPIDALAHGAAAVATEKYIAGYLNRAIFDTDNFNKFGDLERTEAGVWQKEQTVWETVSAGGNTTTQPVTRVIEVTDPKVM